MSCVMHNNTQLGISPAVVTAFYNNNTLVSAVIDDTHTIEANSSKELVWTADVNTDSITMAKVLFVDSIATLKPLTRYRVIYEKSND